MAQNVLIIIAGVDNLKKLQTLEENIQKAKANTAEIDAAIETKYSEFGRYILSEKTNIELDALSPAENKIVDAIGRYVGLMKRDGKSASRTFQIVNNRGLIDAAEVTVAKSKVTQGFTALEAADLKSLSFEQIIVDFSDEFSVRALWFARRTLGLSNSSNKPPADLGSLTQQRTETVLDWLIKRAEMQQGVLSGYSNADVGLVLGFEDLSQYGRVLGNIQSRIDFACYKESVPPLGLCVIEPFNRAWSQEKRSWTFPVAEMQNAARSYVWSNRDLERVRMSTRFLPGQASISWRKELLERDTKVKEWAESLKPSGSENREQELAVKELEKLEHDLLKQTPKVRERISRSIERGAIGQKLKRANGFCCQICEALAGEQTSFIKRNGERYVEAHHVTPVSELEVGSLAASNIMILCANHHRQMHYGDVEVEHTKGSFKLTIDRVVLSIPKFSLL